MSDIHTIHQSCKDCVFASYLWNPDSPDIVPRQVGCSLGRLELFKKVGGEDTIIEAEDKHAQFYIVNNRKCQYYRDLKDQWARTYSERQRPAQARKEVVQRVDVIVVLDDADNKSGPELISALTATLDSLKCQDIKPSRVIIVNNSAQIRPGQLQMLLDAYDTLCMYRTDIVRRGTEHINHLACVDEVFPRTNGHFYSVFRPGFIVPKTFISSIDAAINERLEQFVVLEPVDGQLNGLTVQRGFHKAYDGNRPGYGEDIRADKPDKILLLNIVQKAKFFSDIYERPELVAKASDVCPQFLG